MSGAKSWSTAGLLTAFSKMCRQADNGPFAMTMMW